MASKERKKKKGGKEEFKKEISKNYFKMSTLVPAISHRIANIHVTDFWPKLLDELNWY